jgi:hypothetical protein
MSVMLLLSLCMACLTFTCWWDWLCFATTCNPGALC